MDLLYIHVYVCRNIVDTYILKTIIYMQIACNQSSMKAQAAYILLDLRESFIAQGAKRA